MQDYTQMNHAEYVTESNYLETDSLASSVCRIREMLDAFPKAETETGVFIGDADLILTDAANSIDEDYQRVRRYRTNNRDYNAEPRFGSVYDVYFSEWSMGSELRSVHRSVVLSSDHMRGSDTIVVAPITSANSRRERILSRRAQPRENWNDEAWTCVPVVTDPRRGEPSFVDLKQIRVISPARIKLDENGRMIRHCALTDAEMTEIHRCMARYFNMRVISDGDQRYQNLQRSRQEADQKIKALRKCLQSSKSTLQTLLENPGLDRQVALTNVLCDIEKALKL